MDGMEHLFFKKNLKFFFKPDFLAQIFLGKVNMVF